ncbi:MAG: phosphatase PAP2 family protein [Cyclobacteriaceae bacterium]|nr:phosphatase PAP2 family protein [Cyclobacteriaceae bacterium]
MEQLLTWDRELLLWLNSFHTPWLDPIMFWVTKTFFWVPLYAFLIYLVFKQYKKEGWLVLIGAAVVVLLCDQITSTFMKPFFERLRPSHEPSLQGLVHLVDGYRGGRYGFSSGHAANTFGTALFVLLILRQRVRWIGLVFLWAVLMTYTRLYLGVHYPGDILVGALIGLACGWVGFRLAQGLIQRKRAKQKLGPQ